MTLLHSKFICLPAFMISFFYLEDLDHSFGVVESNGVTNLKTCFIKGIVIIEQLS